MYSVPRLDRQARHRKGRRRSLSLDHHDIPHLIDGGAASFGVASPDVVPDREQRPSVRVFEVGPEAVREYLAGPAPVTGRVAALWRRTATAARQARRRVFRCLSLVLRRAS